MLNKRLLIKNLLAYNDENSFYDKKIQLNLGSKEGKAKFLKHVCALSNSNPQNNSYIVIGIEDESNKIIGVDFYDDSKIQNLVNAYFNNPPKIQYENIAFPKLPRHKVVGLVTINPLKKITSLKKGIWKYSKKSIFLRQGSNSIAVKEVALKNTNKAIVEAIEKNATNNIKLTLDGVFDFINDHQQELNPAYIVFKDHFVLCWAGIKKELEGKTLYSRVDIELVNEQIRLFYSAFDEVEIDYNKQSFIITEYIQLGFENDQTYYPLEKTIINFKENGTYDIASEILFNPPTFDSVVLRHIYNNNNAILEKLEKGIPLSKNNKVDLEQIPTTYLICSLNGFKDAKDRLELARSYLRRLPDKTAYIKLKDALRVLRKLRYSQ
ncbi:ATP-binding protein [Aureibaculum sp. 2210JD6-5]|uniref:ATP-binding protein n=1 Tax=Aureibaculum sp. 2210JD6-5 TaxID=3103957 RepID=UPI002AAEC6F4|nr:ATP-binding protein [Aureibaculum sp. 2210JD6-5]MDY7394646.1 ATP-binding protein [Aureibaculum sp. 2210JD6-5]